MSWPLWLLSITCFVVIVWTRLPSITHMKLRMNWQSFENDIRQWRNSLSHTAIAVGVFTATLGILGILDWRWKYPTWFPKDIITLHHELATELVGIAITVLGFELLRQWHLVQETKNRLKRDMRSEDNSTAILAVEELRDKQWLYDGTLKRPF